MEMVTSSRPVNGGDQTGLLGLLARQARGLRKPAGVQRLDSEPRPGSISLICTAQQLWGAKAPAALSEHQPKAQPKALADVRCTSFQFSKFSLTFHL